MTTKTSKKTFLEKVFDAISNFYKFAKRTTAKKEEDSLFILACKILLQAAFILLCVIMSPFMILGIMIGIMVVI